MRARMGHWASLPRTLRTKRAYTGYILLYMGKVNTPHLVQALRLRTGLSQNEFALRANMAQSAISNYESGRKVPSLKTLTRLARAAGGTLDVTFSPSRPPKPIRVSWVLRYQANKPNRSLVCLIEYFEKPTLSTLRFSKQSSVRLSKLVI